MELQGLSKREILVIAATNRDNYSVKIYSEQKDLWQMEIRLANPERHFQAFTQRGELKTWRELAGVVGYVQETCPDCHDVQIEIGNWKFTRTVEHE
jgi:hypothetical protein